MLGQKDKLAALLRAAETEKTPDDIDTEMRAFVPKNIHALTPPNNSADMSKIQELLTNSVTMIHEDTCKALDNTVEKARGLLERIEKRVDEYKAMLREKGQAIAKDLEATVDELTTTLEWTEKREPNLNNPKWAPKNPLDGQ